MKFFRVGIADVSRREHRRKSRRQSQSDDNQREKFFHGEPSSRIATFARNVARVDCLVARVEVDAICGIHFADGRAVRVVKFFRVGVADVSRREHRRKSSRQSQGDDNQRGKFFHGEHSSISP